MTQEGTEDSLFVLSNNPDPDSGAGGIGALGVDRNDRTDASEEKTPQIYYQVIRQIYIWKKWRIFFVKGLLLIIGRQA